MLRCVGDVRSENRSRTRCERIPMASEGPSSLVGTDKHHRAGLPSVGGPRHAPCQAHSGRKGSAALSVSFASVRARGGSSCNEQLDVPQSFRREAARAERSIIPADRIVAFEVAVPLSPPPRAHVIVAIRSREREGD